MQYLEMSGMLGIGRGSNVIALSPAAGVFDGGECLFSSAGSGR